ncbi:MAG: hypothetical protein V1674_06565 [Candidatus Omnitrophota bacterium]
MRIRQVKYIILITGLIVLIAALFQGIRSGTRGRLGLFGERLSYGQGACEWTDWSYTACCDGDSCDSDSTITCPAGKFVSKMDAYKVRWNGWDGECHRFRLYCCQP